jgi:hypothetical protein
VTARDHKAEGKRMNKILKGMKEAVEVARGNPDAIRKIRVTPSCGCIFCDIGLDPTYVGDELLHCGPNGTIQCSRHNHQ